MSTNLGQYLPSFYNGIRETDELMTVENELFDELNWKMRLAVDDQFIITCSPDMLYFWEQLLGIRYDPATETESFRRIRIINRFSSSQNLTLWWLRERLDYLIGRDYYELHLDYDNYLLQITLPIDNQFVFNELLHLIRTTIPANLIFRLTPKVFESLVIETRVYATEAERLRAGHWVVGETPILRKGSYQEVPINAN